MVSRRTRLTLLTAAALTLGAALLRLPGIDGPLEYDEIWTLERYAAAELHTIFSDLALPNNHPLNSLAVKWTAPLGTAAGIRLSALLAGILTVPAAGFLAWRLFRSRGTALFTMLFLAGSAPAIVYSRTARGYSLQLLLLLLFAVAATGLAKSRSPRGDWGPALLLVVSGIAAELTLPTSVLYLAGISAIAVGFDIRRRLRREGGRRWLPAAAFTLLGVFTLVWYLGHYQQFREAQRWGAVLQSGSDAWYWMLDLYEQLGICGPVFLLAAAACCPRVWMPGAFLVLVPLSALLTHAGPPRAYLPLCAAGALVAGAAAARCLRGGGRLRRATVILSALAVAAAAYAAVAPGWRPIDWHREFAAMKKFPPDMLVVFPAGDGFPLTWNNQPGAEAEQERRMLHPASTALFMVRGLPGRLNGLAADGAETVLPIPVQGRPCVLQKLRGTRYALQPLLTKPAPDTVVIAVIRPLPDEVRRRLAAPLLHAAEWLELNPWLVMNRQDRRSMLLAARIVRPDAFAWEEYRSLARGAVRFYPLSPEPAKP